MKLSKLKRLLDDIVIHGTYFVPRRCLLEDIIRDNSSNICKDCEHSCFNICTLVGMSVLR